MLSLIFAQSQLTQFVNSDSVFSSDFVYPSSFFSSPNFISSLKRYCSLSELKIRLD